jgi:hypothetical protein
MKRQRRPGASVPPRTAAPLRSGRSRSLRRERRRAKAPARIAVRLVERAHPLRRGPAPGSRGQALRTQVGRHQQDSGFWCQLDQFAAEVEPAAAGEIHIEQHDVGLHLPNYSQSRLGSVASPMTT